MKANQRVPLNKFEGVTDRNFTTYNPQVVRDDVFMLGLDGSVKKNRMAVIRSSSAVVVSSQNQNREWVYSQQQTVSAEGYSGQAFNPHFPHTTSSVGTTSSTRVTRYRVTGGRYSGPPWSGRNPVRPDEKCPCMARQTPPSLRHTSVARMYGFSTRKFGCSSRPIQRQ